MHRVAIGLVTILLLASCTDDPTVSEDRATDTNIDETVQEPLPSPTPEAPAPPDAPAQVAVDDAVADEDAVENDGLFPTVVDVSVSPSEGQAWRFSVTLSSEYDSPARYADAWRVLDSDDNELGVRVLTHDHANEQPFTRSHTIDVPAEVATVFVEGRDQLNGWSGERFEVTLDRS